MHYNYKTLQEMGWFMLAAIIPVIASAAFTFDPDKITDWHIWAVSMAAGLVRALGGAVIAFIGKQQTGGVG